MAPGQSKAVFIGNIPFNLSEEQIIQILEQVGKVVKFRLMTNPDTGKPKGFGFADYQTADEAASAVRNLNDYEVQGRKIRVDWPHNNNEKDNAQQEEQQLSSTTLNDATLNTVPPPNAIPSLPPGIDLPVGVKASDAISQTLSTIPPQQLLDVLTSMKSLAISEPARATEILKQAPQLSYAIFQALILMNLVDPKILTQVIEQGAQIPQQQPTQMPKIIQPPPIVPPPLQQPPQTQQFPPQPQYSGFPPPPLPGQYPPTQHQFSAMPPRPPQAMYNTPPVTHTPQPPQLQHQPPQPQQPHLSNEDMIRQILMMDQKTIDSLAPDQRAQVMQIRQNALAQGIR